jgi:class 3 adenylate cyclase
MMTAALRDLPTETARALGTAAALDSQPSLAMVAAALELDAEAAWRLLWPTVLAGFLLPQSDCASAETPPANTRLRFQHDRVQQAAYEAIAPDERANLHARVVRSAAKLDEALRPSALVLADHALLALPGLTDPGERHVLGRILLTAGREARTSVAYERALTYLDAGLSLGQDVLTQPERFQAHLDRYVCEFLTRRWTEADAHFAELQALAPTVLDRAEAMELRIGLLAAQGAHAEALKVTREALVLLGESLPETASQLTVVTEVVRVKLALGRRKPADVARLPETTDRRAALLLKILNSSTSPAFFVDTNVYTVVVLRMCRAMLAHGVTASAPYCWACYAMICGPILGDYTASAAFSEAARTLQARFGTIQCVPRLSLLLDGLVDPWLQHPAQSIVRLEEGVRAGGHAGDPTSAAFCSNQITYLKLLGGAPLAELLRDSQMYEGFSRRQGLTDSPETFPVTARFAELLLAAEEPPELLARTPEADAAWQKMLVERDLALPIHIYHISNAFLNVLSGRWSQALTWAQSADKWTERGVATGYSSLGPLSMALAALCRANDEPAFRSEGLRIARKPTATIGKWAKVNPDGFGHRQALLAAELARAKNNPGEAAVQFELAVAAAGKHGFAHEEGLACLRAAQFFVAQGNPRVAQLYRRGAVRAWERWGATALTTQLRTRFPELRTDAAVGTNPISTQRNQATITSQGTMATTDEGSEGQRLDLTTVLRAAEALNQEIRLDALIERLLRLLIESAGARRALLLLDRQGVLHVEGEIAVDGGPPVVLAGTPVSERTDLAHSLVRTAVRTGRVAGATGHAQDPHLAANRVKSAIAVPIATAGTLRGVVYLENALVDGAFPSNRVALLEALSGQMAVSIQNAVLYRDLGTQADAFRRFVPEQFLHMLGHQDIRAVALGDAVERELTVLFADVRGFTSFSESRPPAEVFRFLNTCLGAIGPLVRRHGGFVDKYIGDAIMALFPADPAQAVRTAVEMQRAIDTLNQNPQVPGDPVLRMGIGIHGGRLALGVLGEEERRETTVIGDAVNTAARLESLTKKLGASILVSEAVHVALPADLTRRRLGAFALAGRQQRVVVYEVIAHHTPERIAELLGVAEALEAAMQAAEQGERDVALTRAGELLAQVPKDEVAMALQKRLLAEA